MSLQLGKNPASKHHKRYLKAPIFQISEADLMHYLALEYATALVKVKRLC